MLLGNTKNSVQGTWSTSSIREKWPIIIAYLGNVIDTVKQEMRLPEDKLHWLLSTLQEWDITRKCWSLNFAWHRLLY